MAEITVENDIEGEDESSTFGRPDAIGVTWINTSPSC
jgi:hypothetical protein